MKPIKVLRVTSALLVLSLLGSKISTVSAASMDAARVALERRYTTPHSLGDSYVFDPRDGWESVNTTNFLYKYDQTSERSHMHESSLSHSRSARIHSSRSPKKSASSPKSALNVATGAITNTLTKILNTIKGLGKAEPVTITWYTGHDLENPSCWSKSVWTPTDKSFAAALTLKGWSTKPKCFKFLELCHTSKKCVFVRVVDSCAGCAADSKHVDLTKAAFSSLADLDEGLLSVQMRQATDPKEGWLEDLWGPK
ncbi:uncharacterized protein BXZ73DRAFT_87697 [Epithele typhae]|uniref:uncharacterized protein n=1 Tax=Epithele typhae TaxID=378194 RepID=UPI002007B672|nr:uncharacterized protein BXZ73DRAFT_87697 [Epithele typhae]KAH9943347.1 hypothetical protein BXZ73DRAFT_87697 [Epithele typhae]